MEEVQVAKQPMLARHLVSFQGLLKTVKCVVSPNSPATYKVWLGESELDILIGEQFRDGGFFNIQMLGPNNASKYIQGHLDVLVRKLSAQIYKNGWRVQNTLVGEDFFVQLDGNALTDRLAELFDHPQSRTYYQHGLWRINFVKMWN